MAVDRDFLAKEIYSGSQLPSYSMVPPGMASYGDPSKADFADKSQLDREDEALKLMKEAGYGEGGKPLDIEIRYNTNPNHERVATAVADMWKNTFGAKVSLVNLDVSSHYAYLQEGGKFNVARAGWVADYADAENFLALSALREQDLQLRPLREPRVRCPDEEVLRGDRSDRPLQDASRSRSAFDERTADRAVPDPGRPLAGVRQGEGLAGQCCKPASEPLPERFRITDSDARRLLVPRITVRE
jgi:hypothetical protein